MLITDTFRYSISVYNETCRIQKLAYLEPMDYIVQKMMKPISAMKNQFRDLQLQQMDAQLDKLKGIPVPPRPQIGWVRAIRESLGMSTVALARRLGITHAGVRKLESSESSEAITLASLRKLAEALDCELRYELIPRTSLKEQLQARAEKVAQERLRPIAHSMALEDQAVQGSVNKLQMDQEVKNLLEGSRRDLW